MGELGKILIADDERPQLDPLVESLRKERYQCDGAVDSQTARKLIKSNRYDLLIADIKMPGNEELEFIRELPDIARGLPVILVTAFPSLDLAIQSIQLPVVAYLVKPIDFEELLTHVKSSMKRTQVKQALQRSQERLKRWQSDLDGIVRQTESKEYDKTSIPLDEYISLTLQNIVNILSDIRGLTEAFADDTGERYICRMLKCPRGEQLTEGIREAVKVLEISKSAFKSKALADLKERLLLLLEE